MQLQQQKVLMPNIFQYEALNELDKFEKENKGGVIVMPTGTGKTFLAVLWFKRKLEHNPNAKLLFICHNKDILSQANEKEFQRGLKDFDISYGYYNAEEKEIKQVTFATTQTLTRCLNKFDKDYFDYVIVDECHHYQARTFKKVLRYFSPKFMLGLTATPYRVDKRNIFNLIGEKVYEVKIKDAIKKNILSKINYYCVDNDIKWKGSEYNEKDLNRTICIPKYDEAILKNYKETLRDKFGKKKTICFCATVEHTHRMAKFFKDNGIKAVGLTGKYLKKDYRVTIHKDKRDKIIKGFRDGDYDIIFVRDLFNEGIDIPDCDSIILLRPTQSHTIFTQQIGRGLRVSENKKDVLILDFTGNARRCIINFEVLSEIIDLDIIKQIKKNLNKSKEKKEIIIVSNGCEVRLSRRKINILRDSFINRKKYSEEDLIEAYKKCKKEIGRVPKTTELEKYKCPSWYFYQNHFGSWRNFLKLMGDLSPALKKYTKEELINKYNECKKKLGRPPNAREIFENYYDGYRVYKKVFGLKWSGFRKRMGDECRGSQNKEDCIKMVKEYFKKYGKYPSSTDVREAKKRGEILVTTTTILKYWGSYSKFMKEIGGKFRRYTKLNKKKIIEDYYNLKKKLGRVPLVKEIDKELKYSWTSFLNKKLFINEKGSYKKFLKEIIKEDDYELWKEQFNKNKNIYSKEKIEEKYLKVYHELGRHPIYNEIYTKKFKFLPTQEVYKKFLGLKSYSMKEIHKYFDNLINKNNNIKIISSYKPKIIIPKTPKKKSNKIINYSETISNKEYHSKEDKVEIREKILSKIKNGDKVLLLENSDLSAIKEIERRGIKPSKIVIPNHLEFNKLAQALRNYKTNLNIECINTSALQYLVDSEEKFDFIWLDYCGAFSYYMKDLDVLFAKHFGEMKLILTYNLFDPAKEDDSYYFTRVIDYVLSKNERNKVRLLNDVTYRYKKNMYNIGFDIQEIKNAEQ